jgi:pyruvate formate lyase activating enzyme
LSDAPENIEGLAKYISPMKNIELVEVLPFHKFGEHKWEAMGLPYQLSNTPEPTKEQTESVREIFRSHGLTVQ